MLDGRASRFGGRAAFLKPRSTGRLTFDEPLDAASDDMISDDFAADHDIDDRPLSRTCLRGQRSLAFTGAFRPSSYRGRTLGLAATVAAFAFVGACVPFGSMLTGGQDGGGMRFPTAGSGKIMASRAPTAPGADTPFAAAAAASAPVKLASLSSNEMADARPDMPKSTGSLTIQDIAAAAANGRDPAPSKPQTVRLDSASAAPRGSRSSQRNQPAMRAALTKFPQFDAGPFPYEGAQPGGMAFLNTEEGEERGHRSMRGRLLRESDTFSDNRSLLHIPKGFDPDRPGVIVVFFHGHGAILKRDVQLRQKVPQQISASGANAVLVAPQFAVDASDSSAGKFWEEGGFARYMDEVAQKLALQYGDSGAGQKFAAMPIVVVSYSGGFVPAAYSLTQGGVRDRIKGLVLLDSIYGELDKFAAWMGTSRTNFLVNSSTSYTRRQAGELERQVAALGVTTSPDFKGSLLRGGAVFLNSDASHRDYVTQAWTENPIADVLRRLPEYRIKGSEPLVASKGDRSTVAAVQ